MSCIPTKENPLCVIIGKAFSHTFVVYTDTSQTTLKDFTGYTGRAFLKNEAEDTASLAQFAVSFGGTAGTITFTLTSVVTGLLTAGEEKVWDLEWTPPAGQATIVMQGTATIILPVTR